MCGLWGKLIDSVHENLVGFFFNHDMKNFRGFGVFLRKVVVFFVFIFGRAQIGERFIFNHREQKIVEIFDSVNLFFLFQKLIDDVLSDVLSGVWINETSSHRTK